MPGVIDQTSVGFSREVGKMAFLHDDITAIMNFDSVEEFADKLLESEDQEELDLLSPPPSSSSSPSRDNADSELETLPDYETPMDLFNFMDTIDANDASFLPGFCDSDCSLDTKRFLTKASSSNKDPFMGHRDTFKDISSVDSPLGSDAILGQYRNPLLDDPIQHQQQPIKTEFSAWGHAPSTDDDEPILFPGSSSGSSTTSAYNDDQDVLPDTPLSYSGTVTGDDSDVDIETIPDTPNSELCGYSSSDASGENSPSISPSPLQSSNKISILQRYSSHLGQSSSSKPLIRYNSCGVSSSVSLAENLMSGRIAGKKRKHHKEKNYANKHHVNTHNTYSSSYYSTTGNSVNFHDYAMCPTSDMSMETAQPTVLSNSSSSSKRIYKRRQINTNDLSEKEKQNHHNQLERNRRQKLADLFIDLRDEVPSISDQSKASKVMILNQATAYIGELNKLHKSQEEILTKELHRKEFFKKQLKQLEAQLSRN